VEPTCTRYCLDKQSARDQPGRLRTILRNTCARSVGTRTLSTRARAAPSKRWSFFSASWLLATTAGRCGSAAKLASKLTNPRGLLGLVSSVEVRSLVVDRGPARPRVLTGGRSVATGHSVRTLPDGGAAPRARLPARLPSPSLASHQRDVYKVEKHFVTSEISAMKLRDLTPEHLEMFLQKRAGELAPQSLNHLRRFVLTAFNCAKRAGRWS
jgi:hypothetical protein